MIPEGMPMQPRDAVRALDPGFNDVIDIGRTGISFDGRQLTINLGIRDLEGERPLHAHGNSVYTFTWHVPGVEGLPPGVRPRYVDGVRALHDMDGWRFQSREGGDIVWSDGLGTVDLSDSELIFHVPYDIELLGSRLQALDGFAALSNVPVPRIDRTIPFADLTGAGVTITSYDHTPYWDPDLWFDRQPIDVDLGAPCLF